MATIQDIFDWLNQGAQGDIPGTGGEQPNAPQASQGAQPPDLPATNQAGGGEAGAVTPGVFQGAAAPPSPKDYASDIPLSMLPHYMSLVAGGLPPAVARSILTQPSVGEGETPNGPPWPQNYQGWQQDFADEQANYGKVPLEEHMWDVRRAQQQNLPTQDGSTAGDNATSGLQQLPTGQYVPYPSQGLDYWAAQGNPQSFYWNPQPGSSWLNDLLGGQ